VGASESITPPPLARATGTAPPLAPPPEAFDPEPPEQPAAAPTRPDRTITAAGTTPNRRIALIETSIVVDGETGAATVRFPNLDAVFGRTFGIPVNTDPNYT
jgi:hypothetical protein